MSTVSTLNVEKVVKAPRKPVPSKRVFGPLDMAAITIPNKKDPIKLIVSVPQGNTFVLENNRESTYRVIAPNAPPIMT